MPLLQTYSDFLNRVHEVGFMPLSQALDGLESLGSQTSPAAWHTGDTETDPWQWKDRAAQEKKLAYASCLGISKGFIAPRFYPIFYAAFHPSIPMDARWADGLVDQTSWTVWSLFDKQESLNTSDLRQKLGVSLKGGASRAEHALDHLQAEFYLTTAGVRRKIAKSGQPYGWPATVFTRVEDWAPEDWLSDAKNWDPRGARETILDEGIKWNTGLDRAKLAKFLGI